MRAGGRGLWALSSGLLALGGELWAASAQSSEVAGPAPPLLSGLLSGLLILRGPPLWESSWIESGMRLW